MQTNYKVSNLETRLYLNNKLLALEKQMEVIRAAISLFEEAEEEIVKHGSLRVVSPAISEEAKIIEVPLKRQDAALEYLAENLNEVLEVTEEVKLTIMSVDDFLINLKRIRRKRNLSISEVVQAHNLTAKELEALESGESRGLKLLVLSLATFYDIHLNDIDKKYKGLAGHYIGELPINKAILVIAEPIDPESAAVSEMMSQAEFFASLKDLRLKYNKTQSELGILIGISNKGYSAFERNCTKMPADTIGPVWKKYGKIIANHFDIRVSGFDPIQPLNKYAGTVKTITTPTGRIKKVFTRTELGINTNGNKIKPVYNKREPKTKPIDEDA